MVYTNHLGLFILILCLSNANQLFFDKTKNKAKRELVPQVTCNEKFEVDLVGTYIDYACCNGDNFVVLTQNGDTPALAYFDKNTLIVGLHLDHTGRGSDIMQGVSVHPWFTQSNTSYIVGSLKYLPDGAEYPCVSAFSTSTQIFEYTLCLSMRLTGAYNTINNINFLPASIACSSCVENLKVAIRYEDLSGI